VNLETDERTYYQIVGDDESDIKKNKVSYQSPIARALVAKEVGDVVLVKTPSGDVEYEIDDVRYI
jgi:transcription elongation factor GreA